MAKTRQTTKRTPPTRECEPDHDCPAFRWRYPATLGSSEATGADFGAEFLKARPRDNLVQVHSIAPLLTRDEIDRFVTVLTIGGWDTLLSGVNEQIQ